MTALQESVVRLAQNDPTLQKLELRSNRIGAEGAQAIADALREKLTLRQLQLSSNAIGDAGAQAIAHALREN